MMIEHSFSGLGPNGFHRLHYYEWGQAENPRVVLCVHGLTRNGRDFDILAQALSDHYRVICPDVIGRGKSGWLADKTHYGYAQYCADMTALIARSGARTVDWVGTSMGGIIGMLMASHTGSPIGRMVINDVGPFIPKAALERIKEYVGNDVSFDSLEEAETYVRFVSGGFGPLSDEQWRHLTETSFRPNGNGAFKLVYDPSLAHAFSGPINDVDMWNVWDAISCPTLLVRGGDSDLLLAETAEEMTRRGPRAQSVEFEGIGHAPMLMSDDQIEAVREFLLADN
jgi:pimeloyl-ACP methyl ester carboxylesterase